MPAYLHNLNLIHAGELSLAPQHFSASTSALLETSPMAEMLQRRCITYSLWAEYPAIARLRLMMMPLRLFNHDTPISLVLVCHRPI